MLRCAQHDRVCSLVTPFTPFRASVWITHIVTRSGSGHRSQASMRGAATRGRKTDLGGLRCADPPGVTMWVIHTQALSAAKGLSRVAHEMLRCAQHDRTALSMTIPVGPCCRAL